MNHTANLFMKIQFAWISFPREKIIVIESKYKQVVNINYTRVGNKTINIRSHESLLNDNFKTLLQ